MNGKVSLNIGVISGFLISHIIISLAFIIGFYSGFSIPFSYLYRPLEASRFILSSTIFISIPYIFFGFLYAGIAKALPKNRLKCLISIILFPFAFLAIWYSCRYFYVNGADGTVWVLYLVTNIPYGSIIGTMSHSADIQSLLLAVPAAAAPLSFFIGMLINRRFVYRKLI